MYQDNYPEKERGRLFSKTFMIRIATAVIFSYLAGLFWPLIWRNFNTCFSFLWELRFLPVIVFGNVLPKFYMEKKKKNF